MPFELGVDFGCRHYGGEPLSGKVILILEEQPYRYRAAISDLAGSDLEAHGGDFATAVRKVRNWITGLGGFERVGAGRILAEYEDFTNGITNANLRPAFPTKTSRTTQPRNSCTRCSNGRTSYGRRNDTGQVVQLKGLFVSVPPRPAPHGRLRRGRRSGLDISSQTFEEIAISIAAQILRERNRR